MVEFDKEVLEVTKYGDLVKLAKKHDVYRRYAPKTELIEKLMDLSKSPVEELNDVSMPSFMENDESDADEGETDTENKFPSGGNIQRSKGTSTGTKHSQLSHSSSRSPLLDKEKNFNLNLTVSESYSPKVKSKPSPSQSLRKSLAGPANPADRDKRLKRQRTFEIKSSISAPSDQSITRRLTRQGTFEVEESQKMKREGTFDIETHSDVINAVQSEEKISVSQTKMLRREATFDIDEMKTDAEENQDNSLSCKFRREGTFEVEDTPSSQRRTRSIATPAVSTRKAESTSNRLTQSRKSSRASSKSPCVRNPAAIPSSGKSFDKHVNGQQSVPRRFITSRIKPVGSSSGTKSPALHSRVPSVINQIENNKVEVSAKKIAEATGEKLVQAKKIPDFNAIHKRLFNKMESLVDSRQKVLDKVSSMQKSQLKFQSGMNKKSPPNSKVVRKLLSPKAGKTKLAGAKSRLPTPKSKLPTPKSKIPTPKSKIPTPKSKIPTPKTKLPTLRAKLATPRTKSAFQYVASEYASNIVCIEKRPSISSLIPGVTKLQSPKFEARGKGTSHFGFAKTEPLRKETLKASVMGKKPTKRNSPMAKAKQALQSVRLNKRFELQMKHRMAQQEQGL